MVDPSPPSSFSFTLLAGEALVCGNRATTPRAPYRLMCDPCAEGLTTQVLREWFVQSIVPLVGPEAAQAMENLLLAGDRGAAQAFLDLAVKYREGSAGNGQ